MLNYLTQSHQKIVVIGDIFVSADDMEAAIKKSLIKCGIVTKVFWGATDKVGYTSMQLNIERNGPDAENYSKVLDEIIEDIDIIITHFCPIPKRLIDKAKNLKLILTCRGGLEHISVEAASMRNIPVVNVIRNAKPVAEFVLGLILSLTRNISISHHQLMSNNWMKEFNNSNFTTTLDQLTIGIVGLGNIGIEVALRLKSLNIKIIAYDKYISTERLENNGLINITMVSSMEELFSTADVITLHLRLTEETEKIIDSKYFLLMKPTSYFINTARGGLVNESDLIHVLENHYIAGAALDVFEKEPIDEKSKLMDLDNIVITPHIAGSTVDAIPKAPFMLMNKVDQIITKDVTDRIVNFNRISFK
ncbi:phosphoglycerate dehydrogenase [Alkalibaculum sp. M08DMB]|uniref:Phosphoglycerate dehydrogenase n=1 Tax=Alkalibaculum sporogenes TaxID=2655001 RepID=A0A6A7KAC2_9FIRM|nr:NAD(P)-dependent oxidoreductase [Alkalibaculum sporogenes]MPW26137.1 phosphoglycerate dehydrogenase [Alkalibaculum sporogenes]